MHRAAAQARLAELKPARPRVRQSCGRAVRGSRWPRVRSAGGGGEAVGAWGACGT